MHGGTFTLKSTLRVGTEVIVTYPPERVMTALPRCGRSPPLQPDRPPEGMTGDKSRPRYKPIMNAGTGI
jgi:two-component system cell cycle sensor histidine kinase PleC